MKNIIKTTLMVLAAALFINGAAHAVGLSETVDKVFDYSDIAKEVDKR